MMKAKKKYRTASSIIQTIRTRLEEAQQKLEADESTVALSKARVSDLQALLDYVEGGPADA